VITELIVNHTSDEHPWFQAARRAPKGSAKRDYYVWSDDPNKYAGTRIIFTDTETSNWAWDPVAQQHYWHRFFSHQPDLNFDNPHVLRAVIKTMEFWLDMGVDGFRLDAIPYLVEREGTSNENNPETHAVVKQIRAALDAKYTGKLLLAEANMWPEDVRQYFGDADECHMAYHFPMMPRLYMSIAMEDRYPLVEIMSQTPPIPAGCQWAIFLRNHDELTLEMVTDRERDYMYRIFANDPRMRVNVGIRRRLAPLMENNRDKIELITFLLMTMPGAPILYYGDEIGMGDNIYLGDRNGVRTPMQWTPGPQRRLLARRPAAPVPAADHGPGLRLRGGERRGAAASPSSLLHWTRKLIATRARYKAFGRGTLSFLEPGQPQGARVPAGIRGRGDAVRGEPLARAPGGRAGPRALRGAACRWSSSARSPSRRSASFPTW
jgi:maltose alpha-D-glucosyltransferase/alpha-amylase